MLADSLNLAAGGKSAKSLGTKDGGEEGWISTPSGGTGKEVAGMRRSDLTGGLASAGGGCVEKKTRA